MYIYNETVPKIPESLYIYIYKYKRKEIGCKRIWCIIIIIIIISEAESGLNNIITKYIYNYNNIEEEKYRFASSRASSISMDRLPIENG